MSDEFNMSMRKFLKQVGVTSQQQIEQAIRAGAPAGPVTSQRAIEEALRNAPAHGGSYTVKAVITCDELGLRHEVTGEIKAQD